MNESYTLANEFMLMVENYYPTFLQESKQTNSPLTKVGFYGAMIEAIKESPLPDANAQKIAVEKISALYENNMELVKDKILDELLNK
jgi:hypothetical protein